MIRQLALVLAALFALCAPAEAHLVNTRLGDFYDGALHPLTGFETILPWLALAILAAIQGAERGRWLFLVFPLGLFFGTVLSVAAPHLGFIPFLNVILIAGVGLLVALGVRLPLSAFAAVAVIVALGQGYDNGTAMTAETDRVLFMAGVTAAGYAFVALVSSLLIAFLEGAGGWRSIALRAGGSWIAAVGIMILAFQLAVGTPIAA